MKNKGWTKFYREQFNHWVSEKKPWCDGYAWTCLYNMANHKLGEVNFRNEYIPVDRGQFITSKLKLENTFGWTRRRLDNFLKALENDEMITYRMTNRFTVITIINYEIYQSDSKQDNKQNDKQVTNRLHTGDKQVSTNKNDKNDKNDKNVKKEDTLSSRCEIIINHLNKKTGRGYVINNISTVDLIRARFNEGRTPKDFITVIDKKARDWLTDDKMNKYVRPSTLFRRTNFENYLNEPEEDNFSKYLKKE